MSEPTTPTFRVQVVDYDPSRITTEDGELGWSLEPARCAVLVHDLLPYYVQLLGPLARASVIEGSRGVIAWAGSRGVPVIASAPRPADHPEQRGLGGRLWGLGPGRGDARTSCLAELHAEEVPWVRKRSLSAFFATDLAVELRRRGRDQLVIVGVFAGQGILATTFDALAHDVEVFVVCDAVADYSEDLHVQAMRQVARSTGQVMRLEELVGAVAEVANRE